MKDFPRIGYVNLSDIYLTRKEHKKRMRHLDSRLGCLNLSIILLVFITGKLGLMIYEDRQRICEMERRVNEKDEMAG